MFTFVWRKRKKKKVNDKPIYQKEKTLDYWEWDIIFVLDKDNVTPD